MCAIEQCTKPAKSLALPYCEMHYYRIRRHGSAETRLRRANGEGQIYRGHFLVTVNGRQVGEHVLVAEQALGHPLPPRAIVHHVNENGLDNRPENLVICEDQGYHNTIHARLKAYRATGNPLARPCKFCHVYDNVANLKTSRTNAHHLACAAAHARRYRAQQKGR